ncbi:MAG: hypothetical protein ACRD7E_04435 [Bryobacteraceae bacterium]
MPRVLTVFISFLLGAVTLLGSDISGIWVGRVPVRNGLEDIAFRFVQDGNKLSGKLYGDYGSTEITDGKIAGNLVIFLVIAPEQAGNQINETRIRFAGRIEGAEIELTRDRESATDAINGGDVKFRRNLKQTFRLKRLL